MRKLIKSSVSILLVFLFVFGPLPYGDLNMPDWNCFHSIRAWASGITEISSKTQLAAMSSNLSGNYRLTSDIMFTAEDFQVGGSVL